MADNINVDPGTGVGAVPVATDDVGGVQYQIIKIATGGDGAATVISSANPLPISDAGGSITVDGTVAVTGSVTASGTVAATQSGTWNIGTVTTLPAITGTVTANVGTGTQAVSGTVTANVGTGIMPCSQSGTWNIGTILALPVQMAAGAATPTTQRVTIDSNQLDPSVAHGDADSGNPIKFGLKATTSLAGLTLVSAADRTDAFAGVDGVQIVRNHCNLEDIVSGNANVATSTSTQVIVTGGSGIKQYLTRVILTNMSATGIYVEMKSGTAVRATIPLPANSGATVAFDPPLPPNAANEAWNFHPSAAAATVYCTAVGFKSKV